MARHPQIAAFLSAYNASAPTIDHDSVTAAELRSLFSIHKPEIVSAGLQNVRDRTVTYPAGPVGVRLYRPKRAGSFSLFGEGYFLTAAMMRWFWRQYRHLDINDLDPRISLLLAAGLSGLSPAKVFAAEFDVLRDEGEDYAQSLARAGAPERIKRWDGQIHDFTQLRGAPDAADTALCKAAAALYGSFG